MKCKNCNKTVYVDMENDLIHEHLEHKGVDSRMCKPSNPDSTIAELK